MGCAEQCALCMQWCQTVWFLGVMPGWLTLVLDHGFVESLLKG